MCKQRLVPILTDTDGGIQVGVESDEEFRFIGHRHRDRTPTILLLGTRDNSSLITTNPLQIIRTSST
jgi:hypothetical protein